MTAVVLHAVDDIDGEEFPEPPADAIVHLKASDQRQPGWIKVALEPAA